MCLQLIPQGRIPYPLYENVSTKFKKSQLFYIVIFIQTFR